VTEISPAAATDSPPRVRADGTLLALALAKLLLHATAITRYGWFRDELYYLVCAQHPAAGYVDQPPLSIWILGLVRALLGDSLIAIRLLPALAGAATGPGASREHWAAGASRRSRGAGGWCSLGTDHYYSMNASTSCSGRSPPSSRYAPSRTAGRARGCCWAQYWGSDCSTRSA
jgi:hypothetical protein